MCLQQQFVRVFILHCAATVTSGKIILSMGCMSICGINKGESRQYQQTGLNPLKLVSGDLCTLAHNAKCNTVTKLTCHIKPVIFVKIRGAVSLNYSYVIYVCGEGNRKPDVLTRGSLLHRSTKACGEHVSSEQPHHNE